jgi:two-component system chemotaxis response regulator CheY
MEDRKQKPKGSDTVAQGPFCLLPISSWLKPTNDVVDTEAHSLSPQRSSSLFDRPPTAKPTEPLAAKDASLTPRTAPHVEAQMELLSFLIVDDVLASCHVAHTILRALGIPAKQIHIATNLSEALRVIRTTSIQMIISDLNLKGESGLDLLEAIRARMETRHISFLLVTNQPNLKKIAEAKKLGVSSCVLKPLSIANLQQHIEYSLQAPQPL